MLPVQLDVSARDPSLDLLASVPELNSLFLCFPISISLSLCLSLSISIPLHLHSLYLSLYLASDEPFRSLLKDKSGSF